MRSCIALHHTWCALYSKVLKEAPAGDNAEVKELVNRLRNLLKLETASSSEAEQLLVGIIKLMARLSIAVMT